MADPGCRPVLRRVEFHRNTARTGAGLAVGWDASLLAEGCRAEGNVAVGIGGGFQVHDGGELIIRGCLLRDNRASEGGGIGIGAGRIEAEACTLLGNRADFGGAASTISGSLELHACVLRGNEATTYGGGVMATSSSLALEACWLDSNRAELDGGGVYAYDSTIDLVEALITRNDAGRSAEARGGAVFCSASLAWLRQCTLAENDGRPGAAVWTDATLPLVLERCLLAAGTGGGAVEGPPAGTSEASCCDVWGNEGGDWTGLLAGQDEADGNLSSDPLFCGAQNPAFPWSVSADSPCAPGMAGSCLWIGAGAVGCGATSVEDPPSRPGPVSRDPGTAVALTASPNPFTGATRIAFDLPDPARAGVSVTIHDAAGRLLRTLAWSPDRAAGSSSRADRGALRGEVVWDGRDGSGRAAPRGIYWARVGALPPGRAAAVRGAVPLVRR